MMARLAHASTLHIALALTGIMLLLSGCGVRGDGAGDTEQSGNVETEAFLTQPLLFKPTPNSRCELQDINSWVYRSMQDYYLFYQQLASNVDTSTYASPEELIRDLRVAPNDTFSHITDEAAYSAFFEEGKTFGYGWNFARTTDGSLFFSLIEPDSPLAIAGVQRGDELVAINGMSISDFDRLTGTARADILGTGDEIKTLTLNIASMDAPPRQIEVTKAPYDLKTVLDAQIIEHNGVSVGYLHFYQFVATSNQELQQAFSMFAAGSVTELVIDLRFNGGGRISVANELASHVVGNDHEDDIFTTFAYNDKYDLLSQSLNFRTMPDSLSLSRVFVLQSNNTCSASELIVNSLRPFMEVITIGSTSCGKPYASNPNIGCGKVLNAIEIELLNAAGVGGYFDGIVADCPASEDVAQALGQVSEPLLSSALNYIDTGNCNLVAQRSRTPIQQLTTDLKEVWQGGNSL